MVTNSFPLYGYIWQYTAATGPISSKKITTSTPHHPSTSSPTPHSLPRIPPITYHTNHLFQLPWSHPNLTTPPYYQFLRDPTLPKYPHVLYSSPTTYNSDPS